MKKQKQKLQDKQKRMISKGLATIEDLLTSIGVGFNQGLSFESQVLRNEFEVLNDELNLLIDRLYKNR